MQGMTLGLFRARNALIAFSFFCCSLPMKSQTQAPAPSVESAAAVSPQNAPKTIFLTDKSNVSPKDISKALQKEYPNVSITNDATKSDYTLEAIKVSGHGGFDLTLFDRDGKIVRTTSNPDFGNAVKDIFRAIRVTSMNTACTAYFTILETDEVTVGLSMLGLNKSQSDWYNKHGKQGEFTGLCYWDETGNQSQVSLEKFTSDRKSGKIEMPSGPVYMISWGESLKSQSYQGSYQTQEQGTVTVTDEKGNSSNGTVTTPVTHSYSGTKHYYMADGVVSLWDSGSEKFIPVFPVHNHNRTVLTSASTSMLKDALEAIKNAEKKGK
jgi:hypothetical protein